MVLGALSAEGALITIAGPAGIGKSRLARHAQRRAGQLGGGVIVGHCDEGSSVPYLPFVEGIGNYILQAGVRNVSRRLGPLALELTDLFPQLEPRHRRPAGEDPQRSKLRLFEAMSALLRVLGDSHNFLLLAFEDVQWADASTLELLSFLLKRLDADPMVLLATVRTSGDEMPQHLAPLVDGWRRSESVHTLRLSPLARTEVGAMAAAILGVDHLDPAAVDRISYLSEGNPLLVEDLIWSSVGAEAPGQPQQLSVDAVAIPTSYGDRVRALLRQLSPEEIPAVQAAAVLSPPFTVEVLAGVTRAAVKDVSAALRAAAALQLVEVDSLGRFQFRHHLIREAVYEGQPDELRRELHRRAAGAYEADAGTAAFEIARHLVASDARAEAVPACLRAADQAVQRKGYDEAARLYEWALHHVTDAAERGRVLARLGECRYATSATELAVGHLQEGATLLAQAGLAREAARARLLLGTCEYQAGRSDAAREVFELVISELRDRPPSEELADAYARLSSLYVFQLQSREARELAEQGLAVAVAAQSVPQQAWARCFLGLAKVLEGDAATGIAELDAAYEIAADNGFDWIAINAVFNGLSARLDHLRVAECPDWLTKLRGLPGAHLREAFAADIEARMLLDLGDVEGSLRAARAAAERATAAGIRTVAAWSYRRIVLALAETGRIEQAAAMLGDGAEPSEPQEVLFDRLVRIRVLLAGADLGQAADLARPLLEQSKWMQRDAILVAAAVEALISAADRGAAEQVLRAALAGGLDPEDPYVQQARARLAFASGAHGEARDRAAAAAAWFKRLGYRLEELRTRLLAIEVKAAVGERLGLERELEVVIAEANACGAGHLVTAARRLGERLGADVGARLIRREPYRPDDSRLTLIARLPHALRENEFVLHYQPEVDLRSGSTVGYEALVRWRRRGGAVLLPERFISVAEQAGLINELTGWVLDNALRQSALWVREGVRLLVAVNVSVHDLERPTFVNRVAAALSANRADPALLCLEVTETSAMRALRPVVETMERLRALGVRLSIDDFGTGQSSLSYLHELPVDEVKLDRSFCAELSESSFAIVRSVITMAHELDLRVVAEGIESTEVLEALKDADCDLGQGYLFGAPALAEDLKRVGNAAV